MSQIRFLMGLVAIVAFGTAVIMGIQWISVELGFGMRYRQHRLEPIVGELFIGSVILFVGATAAVIAIRPRGKLGLAASHDEALLPDSHGTVWVSNRGFVQATNARRLTYDALEADQDAALEVVKRNQRGYAVPEADLPRVYYEAFESEDDESYEDHLGDLIVTGFIILSKRHADVLSRFDLGEGRIVPLDGILKRDRKTPLPGEYALFMLGARKEAFVPGQSNQRMVREWAEGLGKWHLHVTDGKDGDFAVDRSALDGPDFWIDPAAPLAYFMSDRLMTAVREAGLAWLWDARACVVVNA